MDELDRIAIGQNAFFHFQFRQGCQELVQALGAEVAHIKVRVTLDELVAHAGGAHPAGAVVHLIDHAVDDAADGFAVDGGIVPCGGAGTGFGGRHRRGAVGLAMVQDQVQILELVAGFDKGTESLALAHADDQLAGLPQTGGQAGEVTVRGHDAEPIQVAAVQKVHSINDHGRVGGVFAGGVAVLLDGDDGVVQQCIFPAFQPHVRPVAIDALAGGHAKGRCFVQNHLYIFWRDVVRVNENRKFQVLHRLTSSRAWAAQSTYTAGTGSCRCKFCGGGRPFCQNAAQSQHRR